MKERSAALAWWASECARPDRPSIAEGLQAVYRGYSRSGRVPGGCSAILKGRVADSRAVPGPELR